MNEHRPPSARPPWMASTVAATALASAVGLFVFSATGAEKPAGATAPPAVPVSVATVVQNDVTIWDEYSGRTEAIGRVDIRARVSGSVSAVHFREGALVRQGDLLLTIDPAPYAAEVDRAEAQVVAARARSVYTNVEFDRARRLFHEQAIAQREYDQTANALQEANANRRAAEAALQTARLALGYTRVRAPISGRVGRIEVTVGNLVAAGPEAPVLTTLVSVSPIYASFDADEQVVLQALQGLPPGDRARARLEAIPVKMDTAAATEMSLAGRLQLVDNQVDAKSGTVRVRAVFDNADGNLIPGQFVKLRMGQPKASRALLINERAVGTDQSKKFVFVVGADNRATYREVALGAHVDGLVIVNAGLKADERIVVNGLQRVRPGAAVAPQLVAMASAATDMQAPAR
jgi:membrane fusion protein, multidrug efflux system